MKKWVVTLTKSGENCDSGLLKKAIDLKVAMDEVESKLKPFKAVIKQKRVISDSEAYRDEVIVKAEDPSGDQFLSCCQSTINIKGPR